MFLVLKKLQNYILYIICVWSLFFQCEFSKSAFSTFNLGKLGFFLSVLYLFSVCCDMSFEFNVYPANITNFQEHLL